MCSEFNSCHHKCWLPYPVVNKMDPVHTFQPSCSRFILILSSLLHKSLSVVHLSAGPPTGILHWYLHIFPECYIFHTSHHDISGEQYKLWILLLRCVSALLSLPFMCSCSALHHTLYLTNLQTLFTVYVRESVQAVRLWQWCCWGFTSSRMWHSVVWIYCLIDTYTVRGRAAQIMHNLR